MSIVSARRCVQATSSAGTGVWSCVAIVRSKLAHHASGELRSDSSTGASGFAAVSSGQNAAAGQSTAASYPASIALRSAGSPRAAAAHTAMSSSRSISSDMW